MRCSRQSCTKKKLISLLYSADTHFKLNYATLRINDHEIRKKYDEIRWKSFQKLFKPVSIALMVILLITLISLNYWIEFFTGEAK
jgi:hypothetical protein